MLRLALAVAIAALVAAPALSKPLSACANPATVDTVQLPNFMGTW